MQNRYPAESLYTYDIMLSSVNSYYDLKTWSRNQVWKTLRQSEFRSVMMGMQCKAVKGWTTQDPQCWLCFDVVIVQHTFWWAHLPTAGHDCGPVQRAGKCHIFPSGFCYLFLCKYAVGMTVLVSLFSVCLLICWFLLLLFLLLFLLLLERGMCFG